MTYTCPRCGSGTLDSDKGVNARCWTCTNYLPAYQCSNKDCGATYCAADLAKALDPNRPPPQLGGGLGDEGDVV